jgi:plastocyanin
MTTRRFAELAALVLALTLATVLTGCSASSTAPVTPPTTAPAPKAAATPSPSTNNANQAGHSVIVIKEFSFTPAVATVKVGTQVIWQNDGKETHAIAFDDGSVTSPDIAPGSVAGHKFTKAGSYKYHCSHNPQMTGTVVVK